MFAFNHTRTSREMDLCTDEMAGFARSIVQSTIQKISEDLEEQLINNPEMHDNLVNISRVAEAIYKISVKLDERIDELKISKVKSPEKIFDNLELLKSQLRADIRDSFAHAKIKVDFSPFGAKVEKQETDSNKNSYIDPFEPAF